MRIEREKEREKIFREIFAGDETSQKFKVMNCKMKVVYVLNIIMLSDIKIACERKERYNGYYKNDHFLLLLGDSQKNVSSSS